MPTWWARSGILIVFTSLLVCYAGIGVLASNASSYLRVTSVTSARSPSVLSPKRWMECPIGKSSRKERHPNIFTLNDATFAGSDTLTRLNPLTQE